MDYRKYIIEMIIKLTNLNKMYLYTLSTSDLLKLKSNCESSQNKNDK